MSNIGPRSTQGPQYISPEVKVDTDRLILKTYDNVTNQPADIPLTIVKGSRFRLSIEWVDGEGRSRDLTGWSFVLQIRVQPADSAALYSLTPSVVDGLIVFDVPAATTAAYTGFTRGAYRMVATKSADIVRLMQSVVELMV